VTRPGPRGGAACNARGAARRSGTAAQHQGADSGCGGAERTGGEPPQWLRKGGASGKGVILEDAKTLADYGLDYTMGMFEVRHVTAMSPASPPAAAQSARQRRTTAAFRAAEAGAEALRRRAQYLWVDSAENQERFKDEYEKVSCLGNAAKDRRPPCRRLARPLTAAPPGAGAVLHHLAPRLPQLRPSRPERRLKRQGKRAGRRLAVCAALHRVTTPLPATQRAESQQPSSRLAAGRAAAQRRLQRLR
jgi:hypothetical protein